MLQQTTVRQRRPVLPCASWRAGRDVGALAAAPTRRRAEDLGGPRLLFAGPQSACLRARRGRAARRKISRRAKRRFARCPASATTPRPPSPRSLSMRRDPGGRQCRARDRAAFRRRGAAAWRQAAICGASRELTPHAPRRRLRPGHDGSGGDHLHAEEARPARSALDRAVPCRPRGDAETSPQHAEDGEARCAAGRPSRPPGGRHFCWCARARPRACSAA